MCRRALAANVLPADLLAILSAAKTTAASDCVIARAGDVVGSIKHGFASACDRDGLTDVTPHTLRHIVITWMLLAEVPIWEVATFAGMTVKLDRRHRRACHRWIAKRRAAAVLERRVA